MENNNNQIFHVNSEISPIVFEYCKIYTVYRTVKYIAQNVSWNIAYII